MPSYEFEGRWECKTGGSNKFYEIHQTRIGPGRFHCTYGAIGSAGSQIIYNYDKVMKKVRAFHSKGYVQVGSGVRPSEAQIAATPLFEPEVRGRLSAVDKDEIEIENATKILKTKNKEKKVTYCPRKPRAKARG